MTEGLQAIELAHRGIVEVGERVLGVDVQGRAGCRGKGMASRRGDAVADFVDDLGADFAASGHGVAAIAFKQITGRVHRAQEIEARNRTGRSFADLAVQADHDGGAPKGIYQAAGNDDGRRGERRKQTE